MNKPEKKEAPPNAVEGEVLKGHLELLVLSVIAAGAGHGYAIIEALRDRSHGVLDLPEGTIYPLLHRLEDRGLLRSRWVSVKRRRRVYQLTTVGEETLERRRHEWKLFTRAIGSVLAG